MSALVAYGIGTDHKRHLLGIHIGVSESEASWTELLTELVERGLSGVRLIIRDEHAGLEIARGPAVARDPGLAISAVETRPA